MKKQIRVASDLHLEQFYGKDIASVEAEVLPKDERDADSILVLAGDISSKPDQLGLFLKQIEHRFKHVVYVPGNHEYYRHDMKFWNENVIDYLEDNFVNLSAAIGQVRCSVVDGVRFIYGTFWSDGGETAFDALNVSRGLWDFKIIKYDGHSFSVSDMVKIHEKMKSDVRAFLSVKSDVPTIVVSHHMPSYRLCHPRFGNEINGGFASKSEDLLIGESAPDVWIHGHTHDTIDMMLHDTRIVCNPRGYVSEVNASGHNSYAPKFIEV